MGGLFVNEWIESQTLDAVDIKGTCVKSQKNERMVFLYRKPKSEIERAKDSDAKTRARNRA